MMLRRKALASEGEMGLDLLVLIAAVVLVFLRLFKTFGVKPEEDAPSSDHPSYITRVVTRAVAEEGPEPHRKSRRSEQDFRKAEADSKIFQMAEQLRVYDPNFSAAAFLEGASKAFIRISMAYAEGNREALINLLEPKLYKAFEKSLRLRERAGHQEIIDDIDIQQVSWVGTEAQGTQLCAIVRFVSFQQRGVYDANGNPIEVIAAREKPLVDQWTFCRAKDSQDPRWYLSAAEPLEEDDGRETNETNPDVERH